MEHLAELEDEVVRWVVAAASEAIDSGGFAQADLDQFDPALTPDQYFETSVRAYATARETLRDRFEGLGCALVLSGQPSIELDTVVPTLAEWSQSAGELHMPGIYLLASRYSLMSWEGVEEYRVPMEPSQSFPGAQLYFRTFRWDVGRRNGWEFDRALYVVDFPKGAS